jgi:hypothetical protein
MFADAGSASGAEVRASRRRIVQSAGLKEIIHG